MTQTTLAAIRSVAAAWIEGGTEHSPACVVLDEWIQHNPKAALRTIEEICHLLAESTTSHSELADLLAAGPLEDLLCEQGDFIIEDVESLAASDGEFRKLLAGVWKIAMSVEVHARVQRAASRN
jgi:hypothetical protein